MRIPLDRRITLILCIAVLATALLGRELSQAMNATQGWLIGGAVALALALLVKRWWIGPLGELLTVLVSATRGLREGDFSLSIDNRRDDELGELTRTYNELVEILRRERQNLHQRELLLDTVIQATPVAMLLTENGGRVIYSNGAARALLRDGRKLEGLALTAAIEQAPAPLREALLAGTEGLVSVGEAGDAETYQLTRSRFTLNGRPHDLYLLHRLTRELNRQEIATWKKTIRVISHELNNSLAPISSLAHSARKLAAPDSDPRLQGALATIEERAARLKQFLEDYARFAKLPLPRPEPVDWPAFCERLRGAVAFDLPAPLPTQGACFDPGQMQQVLINLLKNAHESGSDAAAVALTVSCDAQGTRIAVLDRGSGMREEVMKNALLPFHSTKASGTGLGLALSREIVEAHGGRLTLANREGGGLAVRIWLPPGP